MRPHLKVGVTAAVSFHVPPLLIITGQTKVGEWELVGFRVHEIVVVPLIMILFSIWRTAPLSIVRFQLTDLYNDCGTHQDEIMRL